MDGFIPAEAYYIFSVGIFFTSISIIYAVIKRSKNNKKTLYFNDKEKIFSAIYASFICMVFIGILFVVARFSMIYEFPLILVSLLTIPVLGTFVYLFSKLYIEKDLSVGSYCLFIIANAVTSVFLTSLTTTILYSFFDEALQNLYSLSFMIFILTISFSIFGIPLAILYAAVRVYDANA